MHTVRYGVVGTSPIAREMISGAAGYPYLKLTAVCSRSAARGTAFAAEVGAPLVFTTPAEMAKCKELDLIYVASPNSCHVEQCRLFLLNGKHVLCEKPLAAFPEQVAELQALACSRGLVFREAIMLLYQPRLELLRRAVEQCGRIQLAQFQFCQLSSKYKAYCQGETPNIFNPAMQTGALMDLGVYCVYPALYLFGEPRKIQAGATFLRTGADGAGAAILQYPDKQVLLTYSKTGQGTAPSEVVGDRGSVSIGSISQLSDIVFHPVGGEPVTLFTKEDKKIAMGREIAQVAMAVSEGRITEQADRLALAVCRCMAQIRRQAGIRFPGEKETGDNG